MMLFPWPFQFLFVILFFFLVIRIGMKLFGGFFDDSRRDDRNLPWYRRTGAFPRGDGAGFPLSRPGNLELRIFRLAHKLKGRITVTDIVLETGLGVQEAEETVNRMVDGMRVRMEVDGKGIVVYEFPEIIARFGES